MADSSVRTANMLFELGTEELPPLALKRLSEALAEEFVKGLDAAGLTHGEIVAYCTPRRLAVLVRDCAAAQPDRIVERRGPALNTAFDGSGTPTKAAEGFARSCGTTVDQLQHLETEKGTWLAYQVHQPGRPPPRCYRVSPRMRSTNCRYPSACAGATRMHSSCARCIGW